MKHLAPAHFAQTKSAGLTLRQWIDAYTGERLALGLTDRFHWKVAGERYDLNETPRDMAECDLAKVLRLAEGWHE